MDLWSTEADGLPEPLAVVSRAAVGPREEGDGGSQLILQVLGQLQKGLDQSEPGVLRPEGRHDKLGPKRTISISDYRNDFSPWTASSCTAWSQVQTVVQDGFSAGPPQNAGSSHFFLKEVTRL